MEIVGRYGDQRARILPNQILESGVRYVGHPFVISEGDLHYNLLTGEVVKCKEAELSSEDMAKRWFLVPEGTDNRTLSQMARQSVLSSKSPYRDNYYTIFTTTKCNGHCKYCFQDGIKQFDMSEEVALDIAKYIKDHNDQRREVRLRWFGGEPLVNKKVITLICNYLRDNGISFRSSMSSNGDLFDKVTDAEIYQWNLVSVQFTIDIPGEAYEEEKGLPKGSYKRLINTVKRLSSLSVNPVIRVHCDSSKSIDIYRQIIDDFKDIKRVSMYTALLYGFEHVKEDYDMLLAVEDLMAEAGKFDQSLKRVRIGSYCMADNDIPSCISTDGSFTPCEHFAYGESYGSIYSNDFDYATLGSWRIKTKNVMNCSNCPLLPICEILSNCPAKGNCNELYVNYRIEQIKRGLRKLL